jgi:hypothetical protein
VTGTGSCSGTFIAANSSTSTLTLNTSCASGVVSSATASGTQVGPDKFVMHEAFKTPDDSIVIYDASSQSYMWNGVWAEGPESWAEGTTTNYVKCGLLSPTTKYCTGHPIGTYTGIVSGNIFSSPYSTLASVQNLFGSGLNPCADTHMSLNSVDTAGHTDSYPFMLDVQDEGGTYYMLGGQGLGGSSAPPCPYYNELDYVQLSGTLPGKTLRVDPTVNTGWHPNFEVQNAIGLQSSSGKYIVFPSDLMGQLGNIDGTHAACNVGGPDWQKSFTGFVGTANVFGNIIAPSAGNAGNYIYQVAPSSPCVVNSVSCTTGSTEPTWTQTSTPGTIVNSGSPDGGATNGIYWETVPDVVNSSISAVQNCRSDDMIAVIP